MVRRVDFRVVAHTPAPCRNDDVVLPAIPKLERHVDELGGPRVTLGVQRLFVDAKITRASTPAVVTIFQPARPLLTWSSAENRRAKLYGELYDVDAVAMRPTCSVTSAKAVSKVNGSITPEDAARRCRTSRPVGEEERIERPRSQSGPIVGSAQRSSSPPGHSPVVARTLHGGLSHQEAFRCSCLVIVVPLFWLFLVETARRWVRWFDRPSS